MKRYPIRRIMMFLEERSTMQAQLQSLTDSDLLDRYRQGDQWAFESLVERYQQHLFQFLVGLLRDPDMAYDVMQHVWIQCAFVFSPSQETETASLRGWLFRVARNRAMDLLRRRTREKRATISLTALALDAEDESPYFLWVHDPCPGPEILAEQREIYGVLLQALATLPSVYQQIVYLRLWRRHTYRDIGQRLGLPVMSVKTYFHRSRLRLSRALSKWRETGILPEKRKGTTERPICR